MDEDGCTSFSFSHLRYCIVDLGRYHYLQIHIGDLTRTNDTRIHEIGLSILQPGRQKLHNWTRMPESREQARLSDHETRTRDLFVIHALVVINKMGS